MTKGARAPFVLEEQIHFTAHEIFNPAGFARSVVGDTIILELDRDDFIPTHS